MPAIEIHGLEKSYKTGFFGNKLKQGLKPLTLSVEEGEVFGYLGPNGAGKTTTLKLLLGLVFPSGGTARILGRDLNDIEVKRFIGFLPEQPYFYDHLTPLELLDYYARLSGVDPRERKRSVDTALARVGMTASGKTQLRKLSKGMLQRVGIAQAIVHNPKLVLLDEPMSGLDPIGRREVRDLVQELNEEGKTIFFSTHILSDAETLCDRVAVLNKGELKGVGVVADLLRQVSGEVEVVWQGAKAISALSALGARCHATGDTVRAVLPERLLEAALDALRVNHARLTRVTPVQATLEDYFLARVGEEKSAEVTA
ncbi:MAG: ABC transporter [Acidobacteria bacterium]|nr:MAG: ABC transporter [Acidobacteriota bacterium]